MSPARIIGEGQTYDGWLQIDAYAWRPEFDSSGKPQFCVWVEFQPEPNPTYGSCLGAGAIEQPIAIESVSGLVRPKRLRDTRVGGALTSDVARVVLSVRRRGGGQPYRATATVAQVAGQLQRELKQPSPFGYFFTKLRGHVATKDIRAIAYDIDGNVIGSTRGLTSQHL